MTIQNLIVLCLDGVGAPWLGPYGNTFGESPGWNRLAADSLLFEFAMAASPQLPRSCAALWKNIGAEGRPATLLTDSREVAELPTGDDFEEPLLLASNSHGQSAAVNEDTAIAQLFAAAADWLDETDSPFTLWLHAAALYGPWDAPYQLRMELADEEDPEPPTFVDPPQWDMPADYDPDELLGRMQAHAGQLAVIDWALDGLLNRLDASPHGADTLLAVTATRGYAMGEHGRVGGDQALHGELLHVPALLRFPDRRHAGQRSQRVLAGEAWQELLTRARRADENEDEWLSTVGFAEPAEADSLTAISEVDGRKSIRTPSWFLTETPEGEHRLYTKPDDRWEVNEVSSLCRGAVDELTSLLEEFNECRREDRPFRPTLSELLRFGYER